MRILFIFTTAFACLGCAVFGPSEKTAEQIAAERVLVGKKTALLERENQVLRDENLDLTRSNELMKAESEKKAAERRAAEEEHAAKLKNAETTIAGLNEKIAILESESGGKIKQLTQLNADLQEKYNKDTAELRAEIKKVTVEAAADKEELGRAAAEKQFNHGKEVQELKQRLVERDKETEELRRRVADLQREIQGLRPAAPQP